MQYIDYNDQQILLKVSCIFLENSLHAHGGCSDDGIIVYLGTIVPKSVVKSNFDNSLARPQ